MQNKQNNGNKDKSPRLIKKKERIFAFPSQKRFLSLLIALTLILALTTGILAYQYSQAKINLSQKEGKIKKLSSQVQDLEEKKEKLKQELLDPSNWKTHQDQEAKIKIKYPPNWKTISWSDKENMSVKGFTIENENCRFFIQNISPSAYEDKESLLKEGCNSKIVVTAGIEFTKFSCPTKKGYERYFFDNNHNYFRIRFTNQLNSSKINPTISCQEYFKSILTTIQFISSSSTTTSQIWEPICNKLSDDIFNIPVSSGDGLTQIARKGIQNYLNIITLQKFETSQPYLTPEEKIFAEDYIRRRITQKKLQPGINITIHCSLIETGVLAAKSLTIQEQRGLERFSKNVSEFEVLEFIHNFLQEQQEQSQYPLTPKVFQLPSN